MERLASEVRGCKMTREDAKKTFDEIDFLTWQIDIINDCIDKIYDGFEEELKKAYIEGGNDAWKSLSCKELAK